MVATVQNCKIGQFDFRVAVFGKQNAIGHRIGFVFFIFTRQHLHHIAQPVFAPQLFLKQFGIVADDLVGNPQNARAGAIILLKLNHFQIGVVLLQQTQVFHVRTTPSINALVIIPHGGELAIVADEQLHQCVLTLIGVLAFVYQQIAQTHLPFVAYVGILAQQ